jgi:soluble lytic murein transglycosylase-like protein
MESKTLAVLALLAVAVVWAVSEMETQADTAPEWQGQDEPAPTPEPDGTGDASIIDEITDMARQITGQWQPPAAYAATIAAAEQANGIPSHLLARLLYQESRWRNDIISGRLKSPAGAVGIAQFMPATAAEWGVNPLDTTSAINGAARYLASLYRRFGTWTQALAAYNWGQGNVARRGLGVAPTETRNYYTQILRDVNAFTGGNLA